MSASDNNTDAAPKSPEPKRKNHPKETHIVIRNPPWSYLHLELLTTPPTTQPLDAITARTHLTTALNQFLGLTGTAISIDILHLKEKEVWIRVPREDGSAVVAAVSGWVGGSGRESVGWRVRGKGEWLERLVGGDGRDLFED